MHPITHRISLALALTYISSVFCLECKNNTNLIFHKKFTTHHYVGCEFDNWRGAKSIAFRGIRYAKPPINQLRFRDPQPIDELPAIQDGRIDGHDCPSLISGNSSEDCLFLNVYSKPLDNSRQLKLLPVIVFIHPGGLYLGTGASSFLGPEYLLEKDIIIVTFNYRLGSLGFLNLGTPDIPGNAGFKDQVMALRWVNENIENFGGDRNNITLMGYSAGGLSVCFHLVSPMSQGLFQKAIIMSGSIPPKTDIPRKNQLELAMKQALIMGCKKSTLSTPNGIVECLNHYSGWEISNTLRKMFDFGKDNPIYLWLPVIEEDFGQERFLIEDPYESLKFGRFSRVPVLIGFTNGEFCTSAKDILTSEVLLREFKQDFDRLSPICFMYSEKREGLNITRAVKDEYFGSNLENIGFENLCNLFSDSIIRFGVEEIAILASKFVEIYRYKFTYKGSASYLNYPGNTAVEHMDDLMYLFKMPIKHFSPKNPESNIVENMIEFFSKFAENRNFELDMNEFFEIGANIEVRNASYFEKYDFWKNLNEIGP